MRLKAILGGGTDCELTDEHSACSYGLPVVLIGGVAHGPGDLPAGPCGVLDTAPLGGPGECGREDAVRLVEAARAAGFEVYC